MKIILNFISKRWSGAFSLKGLAGHVVIGLILVSVAYFLNMGVFFSAGKSVNKKMFFGVRFFEVKRGRYVLIEAQKILRGPHKKRFLVKEVIGVQGDKITMDKDGNVVILGRALKLRSHRADGSLLSSIKEKEVKAGYIFVAGDSEKSFDSRYQEFGLVPITAVRNAAIAIR